MHIVTWPEHGSPPASDNAARWQAHVGERLDVKGDHTIIRCVTCEYIHAIPRLEQKYLQDYHRQTFDQRAKPSYSERYERDRAWWEMTHRHTLEVASRFMDHANHGRYPSVLDVDTGPGIFLDTACQAEWRTWGIQPSGQAARDLQRRGHQVLLGTLEEVLDDGALNGLTFDLVHCYKVLKHIPRPERFLRQIAPYVSSNGVISITVPNDYNPLQLEARRQFNLDAYWLAPPEQLSYFTPSTLSMLVEMCGFKVLDLHGTYPMETFLFDGQMYIGNDLIGQGCHEERMAIELQADRDGRWSEIESSYRISLLVHRIGREICLLAQRVD